MGKLTKMTIENHAKGLGERIHNKIYAKEFGREITELKGKLSVIMKLLHEWMEEDQKCGWRMKKKVKWPIKHLYERNLRQWFNVWMKIEEEINGTEYG
jgi:hypothetical protein